MLKGFKEFIGRGNVVELATAVIIGTAFTAIVTAFTTHVIAPLLAAIPLGGKDCGQTTPIGDSGAEQADVVQVCGMAWQLTDDPATKIDVGAVLASGIQFLIIAAVVYFLIVVPYNKFAQLANLTKDEGEAETDILADIRTLLKGESLDEKTPEEAKAIVEGDQNPVVAAATAGQVGQSAPPISPAPSYADQPPAYSDQPPYAQPTYTQQPPSTPSYAAPPADPGYTAPPAPGEYPPAPGDYPPPPGGEHPPRHLR